MAASSTILNTASCAKKLKDGDVHVVSLSCMRSVQETLDNWGFDVEDIYGQSSFGLVFIEVLCPDPPKPVDAVVRVTAQYNLTVYLTLAIEGGLPPFDVEVSVDPLNGYIGPFDIDPLGQYVNTTYTPVEGYCNLDPTVPDPWNWVVYDPFGQYGEGICTMYIMCPDPPTARDQIININAGEARLIRLQVTGSPPLDWFFYSPPLGGKLSDVYPNYTVLYTPDTNFCSLDGFPDTSYFTVSDPFAQYADGSLTINVICPPEPVAFDSGATISTNQSSINIRPVVSPSGGDYIFDIEAPPSAGTAIWDSSTGTFVYTLRTVPCSVGSTDQFSYVVEDIYGQPPSYAIVTVTCAAS
eukprot:gene10164-10324_t